MTIPLYKMSEKYQQAFSDMEANGFDEQSIKDTLAFDKDNLIEKCQSVAAYIKSEQAFVDSQVKASKDIAERAKVRQKHIDSLSVYLFDNMSLNKITDASNPELDIKIKGKKASVIIDDESKVPDSCKKYVESVAGFYKIDKNLIHEALKDGKVEGCHLGTDKKLVIK